MLLIGVNRSPYTRRVAITLVAYGVAFEQQALSGFGNRDEVRQECARPHPGAGARQRRGARRLRRHRRSSRRGLWRRPRVHADSRRRSPRRAEGRRDDDGRVRQGAAGRLRAQPPPAGEDASALDRRLHRADGERARGGRRDGAAGRALSAARASDPGRHHAPSWPSGWRAGSASTPMHARRACARSPASSRNSRHSVRPNRKSCLARGGTTEVGTAQASKPFPAPVVQPGGESPILDVIGRLVSTPALNCPYAMTRKLPL